MPVTRRAFVQGTLVAGLAPLTAGSTSAKAPADKSESRPYPSGAVEGASRHDQVATGAITVAGPSSPLLFFSKHLGELGWADMGRAVREMGFDGVDLTVRPGGHVLPARVTEDLPRAVAAIRDAGSRVSMLTTGLTSPEDPAARPTMQAAREVDVRLLKAGYYRYAFADVRKELAAATTQFRALVQMAAAAGVVLAYHNHSGYIGAPVWDALTMIDGQPAGATGLYFDVRHATVEGGEAGWRVATQMAAPHLRMLAAKDFYWDKGRDGRWRVVDCPIGEGMVDWKTFAAELRKAGFSGPISLHVEYEPGGRTPAEKTDRMREAAARDRARLASLLG